MIVKILHISATSTGGVGLNLLLLARHMNRDKFELSFALPADSHFFHEIVNTGVKVYPLSINRQPIRKSNIKALKQLLRILREEKFDVVHTHTSVGGFLGRLAGKIMRIPYILWSIHGWAFDYPRGGRISRKVLFMIEKFADKYTDHYVAVCKNMHDIGVANKICAPEKVSVIYHGIDAGAKTECANDIKKELHISDGTIVIGVVGRFELQKGMDMFIHAARIVKDKFTEVKFLIVGDGPLRGDMEAQIQGLELTGDVVFTGWKTNVADYIEVMDIFCLPSRWEAMPLVLLEVMAMGKAIVATKVGGVPEVVIDNEGGLLAPPEAPYDIAFNIERLLHEPSVRERMGVYNRNRVEKVFGLQDMIRKYEAMYAGFIDGD